MGEVGRLVECGSWVSVGGVGRLGGVEGEG